jgi:hypothetical protein
MENTLLLTDHLVSCPKSWKNFILKTPFDQTTDFTKHGDVTIRAINRELKPFNGKFFDRDNKIVFANEQGYSMFLLKFS